MESASFSSRLPKCRSGRRLQFRAVCEYYVAEKNDHSVCSMWLLS